MVGLADGNRTQAKDNTVRLVVLRELEVVQKLDPDPTDDELLSEEEYLQDRGYLALAGIELTRGAYTITPAGLTWLDGGLPESRESRRASLRSSASRGVPCARLPGTL